MNITEEDVFKIGLRPIIGRKDKMDKIIGAALIEEGKLVATYTREELEEKIKSSQIKTARLA